MIKKLLVGLFGTVCLSVAAQTNNIGITNRLMSYDSLSNAVYQMFPTNIWTVSMVTVTLNTTNAYGNTNFIIHSTNRWFQVVPAGVSQNIQYTIPGGSTYTLMVTNGIIMANLSGAH